MQMWKKLWKYECIVVLSFAEKFLRMLSYIFWFRIFSAKIWGFSKIDCALTASSKGNLSCFHIRFELKRLKIWLASTCGFWETQIGYNMYVCIFILKEIAVLYSSKIGNNSVVIIKLEGKHNIKTEIKSKKID